MGNTFSSINFDAIVTVHPHTHGEHCPVTGICTYGYGSSPHAWGTRQIPGIEKHIQRFIPTRMGNTRARRDSRWVYTVHPHTHGEHLSVIEKSRMENGSSPHAWGTPGSSSTNRLLNRFIPTRMGNTIPGRQFAPEFAVHPHTHGEHPVCPAPRSQVTGSSPHAWGTPITK